MYSCTLSLTLALSGDGDQCHASAAVPPGKTQYPLHRRLGGPQNWSERVRKISPPLRLDPCIIQPVGNRCTNYAIPAHILITYNL
jgi:hypothetical protein